MKKKMIPRGINIIYTHTHKDTKYLRKKRKNNGNGALLGGNPGEGCLDCKTYWFGRE